MDIFTKKTRRDFLKEAALGLGIFMMPYPSHLFGLSAARASTVKKRQHLIHMVDAGGWDTNWFYNFFDPALNSQSSFGLPTGATAPVTRYGTSDYKMFDGQKMAPGMHFWNATDLSHLALWKGGQQIVGHNFNQVISGGGSSPYNASYSSIIAASQASTRGPSVLHYVKLSQNQTDCFTTPGMMTGYALPSCIANQAAFTNLTAGALNGFVTRSVVDTGISKLAEAARNRLTRDASKGVIDSHTSGYSGANLLSTSNYASSQEFMDMWFRYFKAMKQEAADQVSLGYGVKGGYQSFFRTTYAPIIAFTPTTITDVINYAGTDTGIKDARSLSWYYAMAAFLVIKDLSCVVDFQPSSGDFHTNRSGDVYNRLYSFAGYRELTRHLASIPNPENTQQTMLDITLLTYCSEFDRDPRFYSENGSLNFGTPHGESFSALIAGHRSNGGHIIGGSVIGDSASVASELKGLGAKPIGVDASTGKVAAGAPILNPMSLLPSVLTMFGIDIPLQQVTEHKAIGSLIKAA